MTQMRWYSRWFNSCAIKLKVQSQSICIKNAKRKCIKQISSRWIKYIASQGKPNVIIRLSEHLRAQRNTTNKMNSQSAVGMRIASDLPLNTTKKLRSKSCIVFVTVWWMNIFMICTLRASHLPLNELYFVFACIFDRTVSIYLLEFLFLFLNKKIHFFF